MKVLVTGGAGFVGSHLVEYYAKKGFDVVCFDNLSRSKLLKKDINTIYNWNFLKNNYPKVQMIKADIRDFEELKNAAKDIDLIFHTAAQTAVTCSLEDPKTDFEINALGTLNVLEAARLTSTNPTIVYCSTNKVYGDNVNKIKVIENENRYVFEDEFRCGIPETFSVDSCEHTPYGCSKLTADLYVQDYGRLYGLRSGVFRMSCIYGPRQFGVEDQGWVAWFTIATILGKPITIYGDGKQVRDVLYIDDLVKAFVLFVNSNLKQEVFNLGGGFENTLSLLELLDILNDQVNKAKEIRFDKWRPSDQKVYISNIEKLKEKLNWNPKIEPRVGVKKIMEWVIENKGQFI